MVYKAKHLLTHSLIRSLAHSLPQYSSCQVAQKATTRERHCCRSAARLVMVSHVRPHSLFSFSNVHLCCDFASHVCKILNLFLSITIDYGNGVFCLVVVPRQFDFCIVES